MPQVEIGLYPDSGRERVVEILLTYSEGATHTVELPLAPPEERP